jgi:dihydroorotase
MLGLETAVPLVLELVRRGVVDVRRAIAVLSDGPARAFALDGGRLVDGAAADVAVIDPGRAFAIEADALASRSKNTPWLGKTLTGRAVLTLFAGNAVFDLDGRLA